MITKIRKFATLKKYVVTKTWVEMKNIIKNQKMNTYREYQNTATFNQLNKT